jgi:hypothetical protein
VNEKPTNALIIQCIDTQKSPTCFGTLKCHHQEIKYDPAEIGAQCRGKQRRIEAIYCIRRCDGGDIPLMAFLSVETCRRILNIITLND